MATEKRLRDLEKPSKYKDLLRSIAGIQVKHPYATLGVILAITILLFGGIQYVRTVASLEKMMPTDIEEIKAFNMMRDNKLGQDVIAVVLSAKTDSTIKESVDILDYRYYVYVKNLKNLVSQEQNIVSVHAFSDVIDMSAASMGVKEITPEIYSQIISNSVVKEQLKRFVNFERTNTFVIFMTDISADDLRMNLLSDKVRADIDSIGKPSQIDIAITGTPIIQQKLGEVIEHDRQTTERVSAFFVFLAVGVVFGSIAAAIVPMVTIILSIIWLYGFMGYLGLPISTLAGGVAAMVIGIGVDYSIHLRNKFEYELRNGAKIEYAVEETMANTGYVLTFVTLVTAIAFMTFTIGQMPEMGRFGLLMGIGVGLAFTLSVIGLPALFVIEDKIRKKISLWLEIRQKKKKNEPLTH